MLALDGPGDHQLETGIPWLSRQTPSTGWGKGMGLGQRSAKWKHLDLCWPDEAARVVPPCHCEASRWMMAFWSSDAVLNARAGCRRVGLGVTQALCTKLPQNERNIASAAGPWAPL